MSLPDWRTFGNNIRRADNSSRPLPYRPPGVLLGPRLGTDHSFFARCDSPVGLRAAHSMVAAVTCQQIVSFAADSCEFSGHAA
jgi:hypothetical protein